MRINRRTELAMLWEYLLLLANAPEFFNISQNKLVPVFRWQQSPDQF